jgi:2-polyprenyl-3-methyl-5-hydroxy-6-metoxy-1,4-benzoquinol methylase
LLTFIQIGRSNLALAPSAINWTQSDSNAEQKALGFERMAFERIVPGTPEWTAYHANHIQRYRFAADTLARQPVAKILDVACGAGYGAHFLATRGIRDLVAVDNDSGALDSARKHFSHPAISYVQDDCHTLLQAKQHGPFDVVVSFETIEHLKRPADFLNACRECLCQSGLLIISTPNATVHQAGAKWEFHEKEFTASEFESLLRSAGFRDISLFGQCKTAFGRLREDIRAELHVLRTNPFLRLGRLLQRLRHPGYEQLPPPLPERAEDFEITPFESAQACDAEGTAGPFVIIATART